MRLATISFFIAPAISVLMLAGSPLVYAKAYENGNKRAVLVWNISDKEAAAYTVTPDAGWTQVEITSPEGPVAPGSPLAPQSLHLLVFKK